MTYVAKHYPSKPRAEPDRPAEDWIIKETGSSVVITNTSRVPLEGKVESHYTPLRQPL